MPQTTTSAAQSDQYVVLATLKRAQNELSSYQRKVFKIDDHMGIAIAGLTADGRVLCKYMRGECLNHRWGYTYIACPEGTFHAQRTIKHMDPFNTGGVALCSMHGESLVS